MLCFAFKRSITTLTFAYHYLSRHVWFFLSISSVVYRHWTVCPCSSLSHTHKHTPNIYNPVSLFSHSAIYYTHIYLSRFLPPSLRRKKLFIQIKTAIIKRAIKTLRCFNWRMNRWFIFDFMLLRSFIRQGGGGNLTVLGQMTSPSSDVNRHYFYF